MEETNVFKESCQYLLGKLQKDLKEQGFNVRTKHLTDGISLKINRDFEHEKGFICLDVNLFIDKGPTSLWLSFIGSEAQKDKELISLIIYYVKKIAKKLKVNAILMGELNYIDFVEYGFQPIQKLIQEKPITLLGSVDTYNSKEQFYSFEVMPKKIKERLKIYDKLSLSMKCLEKGFDETLLLGKQKSNVLETYFGFYYQGIEELVVIAYNKPTEIRFYKKRFDSFSYSNEDLVKTVEVLPNEEMEKVIKDAIDVELEGESFARLANPPQKHFDNYCKRVLGIVSTKEIFEKLRSEMHPHDIEKAILKETKNEVHSYKDIHFFQILQRYFICYSNEKVYEMYNTAEEGITEFDKLCKEKEHKQYQDKLREIDSIKQQIEQDLMSETK